MQHQARVVIFCGKGGVGKTTLALAHGLRAASSGLRTVVVTSHPLEELALAVSLEGLEDRLPTAARGLFIVHLDPKELLAEVVRENFPVQILAETVLRSAIYNNLVEVAPGLKEFYFLARLQQLAERKAAGAEASGRDFDLLLWDAPASGHFLGTLRAAKNFEVYLSGPLAAAGADLARFFSNPEAIVILPVTTLEEMAIAETHDLCRALHTDFHLSPTRVLMNLTSPAIHATTADAATLESRLATASPALRFAATRALTERDRAAALARDLAAPTLAIERRRHWTNDIDLLEQIGDALAPLPSFA
ncbi:MAG: ArsA-related P-loop ATPase [Bryobacteraceae bacterium]